MPLISAVELQNVELLAGFSPSELDEFASQLNARDCSAEEIVFSSGDFTRSLYLILSGRVQIDLVGQVVEESPLADLGPRDVFGETTFFHAASHDSTARCLEDSRLAELSYATYEALLRGNCTMAYHLGANAAHILAARLQATDAWIRDVLDRDEEQRRRELRKQYHSAFRPAFTTPTGFVGLGVNW